jgi:RPA family protein
MADYQGRQVAYKVRISDINEGSYVKEEGWQPNYVITKEGLKVSRANIIATVVSIEPGTPSNILVLDDGTGTLGVRAFGEIANLGSVEIGDIVNVIGKPREFSGEKYIVPEIITKVKDEGWVKLRQKEMSMPSIHNQSVDASQKSENKITAPMAGSVEEEVVEKTILPENPFQKIYRLIKELDTGDGADTNELVKSSGLHNADELVKELLKEGEIFEIKRGRLKILE